MEIGSPTSGIDPIFVSVKEAARALNLSTWVCYQLLDDKDADGNPKLASVYHGRRRLVRVDSLREYARNLPTEAPASPETA